VVYTALLYFYYSYLITRLYPSLLSNNETNAQSSVSEGIEQVAESLAALDQDEEDIMSDQISILTAMSEDEGEEEDESNISSSDWTDVEILQWGEWMPQKNHSAEDIQHNMNHKSLTNQDSDKYEDDQTSTRSTLRSQSTSEGLPNVKRGRGRPKKGLSLPEGVSKRANGNWLVRVQYQGSQRYIGTFPTLEQATLANDIARDVFEKDEGLELSAEECERNIKLAKEAAWKDVPGKTPGSGTWTDTEHQQFKQGCILFGWGNWKDVERVVKTRTNTQIMKHSQHYAKEKASLDRLHELHIQGICVGLPAELITQEMSGVEDESTRKESSRKLHVSSDKESLIEEEEEQSTIQRTPSVVSTMQGLSNIKRGRGRPKKMNTIEKKDATTKQGRSKKMISVNLPVLDVKVNNCHDLDGGVSTNGRKRKLSRKLADSLKLVAKKKQPIIDDESKKSPTARALPQGVCETPNGTWRVQVYYQSCLQYIGTFQTLEQATLANEIARGMLKKDKGLRLSPEECEQNVKQAKEAASASCAKRGQGRPKKAKTNEKKGTAKRGRGRPKKVNSTPPAYHSDADGGVSAHGRNRKLSKKKADTLDLVVEKKKPDKKTRDDQKHTATKPHADTNDQPVNVNGSNQRPKKKRPAETQKSFKGSKKVKPNESLNDAGMKRVNTAIEAVTTTYGVGVDMQTKLAAAVLRGVTCRPSGKCKSELLL